MNKVNSLSFVTTWDLSVEKDFCNRLDLSRSNILKRSLTAYTHPHSCTQTHAHTSTHARRNSYRVQSSCTRNKHLHEYKVTVLSGNCIHDLQLASNRQTTTFVDILINKLISKKVQKIIANKINTSFSASHISVHNLYVS